MKLGSIISNIGSVKMIYFINDFNHIKNPTNIQIYNLYKYTIELTI